MKEASFKARKERQGSCSPHPFISVRVDLVGRRKSRKESSLTKDAHKEFPIKEKKLIKAKMHRLISFLINLKSSSERP